jgi:hypothetical protein
LVVYIERVCRLNLHTEADKPTVYVYEMFGVLWAFATFMFFMELMTQRNIS